MRKRGLHRLSVVLCAVLTAALLTGCGGSDSGIFGDALQKTNTADQFSAESFGGYYDEAVDYEAAEGTVMVDESGSASVRQTDRKLIKNVDMDVETKEFDTLMDRLSERISEVGGYVESMNVYNGSVYNEWRSNRSAQMVVRIPQDRLDDFLNTVTALCNVTRRNEKEVDVTLTYVDLESHKEALQTERDRLMELLSAAETVEDIITIESRLSEIRYQIESMESQLRTYDNQVNYSTVNLEIEEVKELTPVEEETVWERISGGFVNSLQNLGHNLTELCIWILVNSPYLVIWAAVITVLVLLWRRIRKKKGARLFAGKKRDLRTGVPPVDQTSQNGQKGADNHE